MEIVANNTISTNKQSSQFLSANPHHLKSLHMPYKKKEAYRIDDENQKLIDRITNAGTTISTKKLEKEYEEHLKHKKLL